MATADHTTKEKKMSKSVNIICYIKGGSGDDVRSVIDSLDDRNDYLKKETKSSSRYYAVTRNGVAEIDEDEAEVLRSAEGEELMVREKVTETESFSEATWKFSGRIRSDVLSGVDAEPPSIDAEYAFGNKVKWDGEYKFKVLGNSPNHMGLLKHPSDIEDGSDGGVWDDKHADLVAVKLTVNVNEVSPTVYRYYDNTVVPEIVKAATQHEWVERTRVMDCSKEVAEEGVCYDAF